MFREKIARGAYTLPFHFAKSPYEVGVVFLRGIAFPNARRAGGTVMTSEKTSYDKLVDLIKERHPEPISDQQAHRLARNLMGYCELVIRVAAKTPQEVLDNHLEYSSLLMRRQNADAECRNSISEGCASAHE